MAAPGVLADDIDAQGQVITVAIPRPVSGPSHGTLTIAADGSFSYTPDAGYTGTDTFGYAATDGDLISAVATVTITVTDTAYISASDWSSSFDPARYLDLTFPAYVAPGSVVSGATFRHAYRSATDGDTTCYYFEVYSGGSLLATHGSASSPVSCNGGSGYVTDVIPLPEVDSDSRADDLTVRLFVRNSGGRKSAHLFATIGVDSSHD